MSELNKTKNQLTPLKVVGFLMYRVIFEFLE